MVRMSNILVSLSDEPKRVVGWGRVPSAADARQRARGVQSGPYSHYAGHGGANRHDRNSMHSQMCCVCID